MTKQIQPTVSSAIHPNDQELGFIGSTLLEFKKVHRKHLWLIVFGLIAAGMSWLMFTEMSASSAPDYRALLFRLPIVNAIFLPLLSAIVASTLCDIEFRAHMLKELLTMQRTQTFYLAKWVASAFVLAIGISVQIMLLITAGAYLGYTPIPFAEVILYGVSTFIVCVFIATLIQTLSFFSPNPFIPIATGVVLSFLGLFSLYLPTVVSQLVPSSYYALLATAGMTYDEVSKTATFFSVDWSIPHFLVMMLLTAVVLIASCQRLTKKEF